MRVSDKDLLAHHIIPVVVLEDAADAAPLAAALTAGGLPVAEVTFRTAAAAESIAAMAKHPDMIVGAGTVITADQLDTAADAGASFIVSPGLNAAVVKRARERDLLVLPGAVTPSEIMATLDLGLTLCKFFPAATFGGPGALKSLGAPFRQVRFVPTGGVSAENLPEYLTLPNVAAVGGSWMVKPSLISAGDFDSVTRLTTEAVAAAAAARK
ncbi:bifunctional 4-hydroxy-2-oxoglutarate aldolase/2-dehydro-3-deoxy-phosphogluconate aldolase [Nigerium massiliense]|uniref:bifunctional 4-hydroxy-2-oxoglutarate aldolase/2-dehydro-3-deoxy-phosphogluconate aldolase n=1 Tax=Nigerium massiliense TaxID=1522317 RepID=UPI00058AC5E6